MRALRDSYDRQFQYLRLSLTEVCNFRCSYCLPDGYKTSCSDLPLEENEIIHLLRAFSELGISKVRLTGGEPTVRQDLVSIVQKISQIDGIKKIALTTNGYCLQNLVDPLLDAGLTNLNVSVDSLKEETFHKITGKPFYKKVMAGLEKAVSAGLPSVKINTVLLKDLNDFELPDFVEFVRDKPVSLRFIELMQTGTNGEYFRKHHLSTNVIVSYLQDRGWCEVTKQLTDGPAIEFSHPDYAGRIGIISPYANDFCKSCNRLRISARGRLRLCLFGDGEISLRELLFNPEDKEELKKLICTSLQIKPSGHRLHENIYGMTNTLSGIGG